MADALATYAFEFKGGLVSNLSPLQQGLQQPGTARILRNFEPSVEGGYKKILGLLNMIMIQFLLLDNLKCMEVVKQVHL